MTSAPPGNLLLHTLSQPESMASLGLADWNRLLRQARQAGVAGRLAALLEDLDLTEKAPERAGDQLLAARRIVAQQHRLVRWEVECVRQALEGTGVPLVLLKGAAYLLAGLPPARGRLFVDVDLMVPEADLARVEETLLRAGWEFLELDAYDERYYRAWSHELPPLSHRERSTVVDVHHNILPRTSRLHPDARLLLADARPIPGSTFRMLAPPDMVLHTAVHLFQDGDLHGGLRDLIDLDASMRHFGPDPGFWEGLVPRARQLGLQRPLFYALRYAARLLETPVPAAVRREAAVGAPPAPTRAFMDRLVTRALVPREPGPAPVTTRAALWMLYVRSHWLRMPPLLLARHLARKALRRRRPAE